MKKKTISGRQRRLAGEAVEAAVLSPSEERLFSALFTVRREWHGDDPDFPAAADAAEMRAREAAAKAVLPFFCQHFEGKKYSREDISSALAAAVSLPVRLTEWCAEEESFLSGAAYWLLDYVAERELEEKLFPLLPANEKVQTILAVPNTNDLAFDKSVVLCLTELLLERKGARQKEFRKAIGLIKKDDAAKLRAAFRDAVLDYFSRFLQVRTRVKARSAAKSASLAPLSAGESPLAPLSAGDVPFASLSERPLAPLSAGERAPLPAIRDLLDAAGKDSFPAFSRDLIKQRPDLCFLLKTPDLIGASPEKLQSELHYRRMTGLLSDFTVADPYAICAAFVLLERENDLLADLNALTAAVLSCADRHLPWSCEEADVWQRLTEEGTPDYGLRFSFQPPEGIPERRNDKRESWGLWEEDAGSMIEAGQLLSEVQLFYLATGYLFPRKHCGTERLKAWFQKNGVPEVRAGELAFGASLLSCMEENAEVELWNGEEEKKEAEPTPPEEEERRTESEEKIADLMRQLKASRQALHEAEQSVRQMRSQLQEGEKRAVQDRMELSGLRETLFRMKSGEESPEERPEGLEFPWQVKRRVLVFGGHDTWSKAIRPLLPGARFFERESLPDLNAIKGADVVWIQANALSHKFYYRIIDTARREGIPVQYFSFASARKCAEQLAAYELSADAE